MTTGEMSRPARSNTTEPPNTARKMPSVPRLTTDFFHSLSTALKISTHTHTLMPANASCTAGYSAKFCKQAAMIEIMTSEGKATPSVAITPPATPQRR